MFSFFFSCIRIKLLAKHEFILRKRSCSGDKTGIIIKIFTQERELWIIPGLGSYFFGSVVDMSLFNFFKRNNNIKELTQIKKFQSSVNTSLVFFLYMLKFSDFLQIKRVLGIASAKHHSIIPGIA